MTGVKIIFRNVNLYVLKLLAALGVTMRVARGLGVMLHKKKKLYAIGYIFGLYLHQILSEIIPKNDHVYKKNVSVT